MGECWKLDNNNYALYVENLEVLRSIRRYYKDFELMATYEKKGKVFAEQYRVPLHKKRVAKRLAKKACN
ncbi:hypothetical protein [Halobacillus amylolyticus]|uniref:Uncharacterized protein n=1 Tax=Halobacillus amylolyticus TaxID=2932259 RepID=A0ABY4HBV0_9BACI|nr:hypothetical protein [Halobacillus amylolyticus]UOR12194.1 hypothetical protein MUO15_01250 [Halobacillus amylolyticus]